MIDTVQHFVIPAAYSLLPAKMNSKPATAMLLAIGLQESRFLERSQGAGGPARGFWQFEPGPMAALAGVLTHKQTKAYAQQLLERLRYPTPAITDRYLHALCDVLADNDVLAASFARLLLWTVPQALPEPEQSNLAWSQYIEAWRPGAPRPETWTALYTEAWHRVDLSKPKEASNGGIGASSLPGGLSDHRVRGRRDGARRPPATFQTHRTRPH